MKSYSQFGEDRWILEHLPLPQKGVFCEVGAYDGVASSNTKAFEEEGWTGICIEPDPEIAKLCRKNRTCVTLQAAIGIGPRKAQFFVHPTDRGQSRICFVGETGIEVPLYRLDDVLLRDLYKIPDLLSIDTEGSELMVWESGGSAIRPPIVIMEFLTWGSPPRDKEIVARLTADGYKEVHRTEANLIFTRH